MYTVSDRSANPVNRRSFLGRASALATAPLVGITSAIAAEAPPETTKIRFVHGPWLCYAPQYLAEEFLRMEGFTEVEYQKIEISIPATRLPIFRLSAHLVSFQ